MKQSKEWHILKAEIFMSKLLMQKKVVYHFDLQQLLYESWDVVIIPVIAIYA